MINKIMENGIKEMSLCTIFYFAEKTDMQYLYLRKYFLKKKCNGYTMVCFLVF